MTMDANEAIALAKKVKTPEGMRHLHWYANVNGDAEGLWVVQEKRNEACETPRCRVVSIVEWPI